MWAARKSGEQHRLALLKITPRLILTCRQDSGMKQEWRSRGPCVEQLCDGLQQSCLPSHCIAALARRNT